ncbi:hypothetical protein GALMADRAFT_147772 [Galerina marginata CBS 339.88]|uniref:DUF6534 domain-containing protein n=1 Tax=Galerina marginata (strain CBS 339.88) TaxID=685588 RepID=A0A067S9B2_GALM3|nr:hypothetical protein GALMADRAFT_147772 [Galerina marginata CBS 339.88]
MLRYVDPFDTNLGAAIQGLYGPVVIGVLCSMILYGILVSQMYNYHVTYKSDLPIVRYLVLYLFVAESVHTAIAMFIIYQSLVLNFGKDSVTHDYPTTFPAGEYRSPRLAFLAWRIWRIQKSFWIPVLICILAVTSGAGGIWAGVDVAIFRVYADSKRAYPPGYLWLSSSAAADILITASLTTILSRRKTGIPSSDAVISRIIIYTVQTGLVTSIAAIADVVLLIALPHITLNFLFDVSLVKIYSISLISSLNVNSPSARKSLNRSWNNESSLLFNQDIEENESSDTGA